MLSSARLSICSLTARLVRENLPSLLQLDADTPGERWTSEHWLKELPAKWQLSQIVLVEGRPVAVLVASQKAECVHIHRLVVDPRFRRRGLAKQLMVAVASGALRLGSPTITLKVRFDNVAAIAFYERLAFRSACEDTAQLLLTASPDAVHLRASAE